MIISCYLNVYVNEKTTFELCSATLSYNYSTPEVLSPSSNFEDLTNIVYTSAKRGKENNDGVRGVEILRGRGI